MKINYANVKSSILFKDVTLLIPPSREEISPLEGREEG
jgi:hypothetical protein